MAYVRENREDRRLHRSYHDEVLNGVPGRPLKSDRLVWRAGCDRITAVTPLSPDAQRVRARKVAQLANREMRYDTGLYHENELPDERSLHMFLYYRGNRIVALTILERRNHLWRCTWEEYERGDCNNLDGERPIWSLIFTWVLRKHRGKGIASRIFSKALQYLHATPATVGVYTPFSQDGEKLVRALFPQGFLIAK